MAGKMIKMSRRKKKRRKRRVKRRPLLSKGGMIFERNLQNFIIKEIDAAKCESRVSKLEFLESIFSKKVDDDESSISATEDEVGVQESVVFTPGKQIKTKDPPLRPKPKPVINPNPPSISKFKCPKDVEVKGTIPKQYPIDQQVKAVTDELVRKVIPTKQEVKSKQESESDDSDEDEDEENNESNVDEIQEKQKVEPIQNNKVKVIVKVAQDEVDEGGFETNEPIVKIETKLDSKLNKTGKSKIEPQIKIKDQVSITNKQIIKLTKTLEKNPVVKSLKLKSVKVATMKTLNSKDMKVNKSLNNSSKVKSVNK